MELDSCVNLATRRRQRQPGLTVLSPVTVRACWEMGTKLKGLWKYFFHLHDLVHLTSHLCSLSNRRLSSTCTFVKRSPDPKQGQCQITAVVWHGCPLARVGVASEGINSEPELTLCITKTPRSSLGTWSVRDAWLLSTWSCHEISLPKNWYPFYLSRARTASQRTRSSCLGETARHRVSVRPSGKHPSSLSQLRFFFSCVNFSSNLMEPIFLNQDSTPPVVQCVCTYLTAWRHFC